MYFNPLAHIIAVQDIPLKRQNLKQFQHRNIKLLNNFSSKENSEKEKQDCNKNKEGFDDKDKKNVKC